MGRNAPRKQGNIWQEIRREVVISGLQFVEICSKSLEKGLEKW